MEYGGEMVAVFTGVSPTMDIHSSNAGSAESVAAYNDYLQAVADEVPYILFVHLLGFSWTQADVVNQSVGQVAFYWNNYFTK